MIKILVGALDGVAQLVGVLSYNQKVRGLIPGQGTCLRCGSDSAGGSQLMFLSLSLSLSLSLK